MPATRGLPASSGWGSSVPASAPVSEASSAGGLIPDEAVCLPPSTTWGPGVSHVRGDGAAPADSYLARAPTTCQSPRRTTKPRFRADDTAQPLLLFPAIPHRHHFPLRPFPPGRSRPPPCPPRHSPPSHCPLRAQPPTPPGPSSFLLRPVPAALGCPAPVAGPPLHPPAPLHVSDPVATQEECRPKPPSPPSPPHPTPPLLHRPVQPA